MPHRPLARRAVAPLAAALLGAGLALGGPTAGTATAAPDGPAPVRIDPQRLPRGEDQRVAHVEGRTVVDGSTRVGVDAQVLELLGEVDGDYLVSALDDQGRGPVLRVDPDGTTLEVAPPARGGELATASADGSRVAQVRVTGRGTPRSVVTVHSTTDGAVLARRRLPGVQTVLDVDARQVLLGDTSGTRSWRTRDDRLTTLTARAGYRADLASDRLASYTGDPYDGGCTVVSRVSAPQRVLWRSCAERVEVFSPGGSRLAAVDLLADGLGPSQVVVRNVLGRPKGVYRVRGYLGGLVFETPKALLLDTFGRRQAAVVRCVGSTCVRASDLRPTPPL